MVSRRLTRVYASISLAYAAFSSVKSASYKLHSHKNFQPFRDEISSPPKAMGWRASYHPDHSGSGIYLPWKRYRIGSLFLSESLVA